MKLNFECIKDVLLFLEKELQLDDMFELIPLSASDIYKALTQYTAKEIYYTLKKLAEEGYICAKIESRQVSTNRYKSFYCVSDITFKGHQYLNSVRNQSGI